MFTNKFLKEIERIKDEYDLTKEQTEELIRLISEARGERHLADLKSRYGENLLIKAFKYCDENLSPLTLSRMRAEQVVERYLHDRPKEVSSKELSYRLGRDKRKPPLVDPFEETVDLDRFESVGENKIKEKPKEKVRPPKLRMPSQSKIDGMSSEELAKLIQTGRARGIEE
jgi:hypothetical protein